MIKHWIQLARPRTFPLAVASIICGTSMAYAQLERFTVKQWGIFALTLFVALNLQILSNMANDYGDGTKGTDTHRDATSPQRLTAHGHISITSLKRAIIIWALFTFGCGMGLLWLGFDDLTDFLWFLAFGISAIIAAMAYTMGKRPYGYRAMGEVAVLIFFGWMGVLGSTYLQLHYLHLSMILPATGCGLLAAAALYVNNMRDRPSDQQAGKITLAVLLGLERMYHGYVALVTIAIACHVLYALMQQRLTAWLWLLAMPWVIRHIQAIKASKHKPNRHLAIGQELKPIIFITLMINLLFAISQAQKTEFF